MKRSFLHVNRIFPAAKWIVASLLLGSVLLARTALVDINSATIEELKTLPGIRDAKAAAIVRGRPYANKGQLLSRKILSPAEYRQIKDLIVARQP
jgi:DNA uptake protein ComE-like DNA-binding protein